MQLKSFYAQDDNGNILPLATCHVYLQGTSTYATGLQNASGGALTNPFNATANGLAQFAAPYGLYDLRTVSGGRDSTIRVDFRPGSFLQSGTGAVEREANAKMGEVVSVKDFGAVGNGIADDTAAIIAAIAQMGDSGYGGTVLLPWGDYRTTGTIYLPNLVRLIGEGMDATNIRYTGNGTAVAVVGTSPSPVVKAGIKNLSIYGNVSSQYGLNLQYAVDCFFEDLRIYNHNIGIYLFWSYNNVFNFVKGEACYQDGFYLDDEANANLLAGCMGVENARAGLYQIGGRAVMSVNCTWEANDQYGVYCLGDQNGTYRPKSLTLDTCYIEGNGTCEVYVAKSVGAEAPIGINIKNCYFCALAGKATQAIRVQSCAGLAIVNNTFDDQGVPYAYSVYAPAGGTISGLEIGFNSDRSTNGVYREVGAVELSNAVIKASGQFNGKGGATLNTGYNVSSVVRNSAGSYTVTFQNAMPSGSFPVFACAEDGSVGTPVLVCLTASTSATTFNLTIVNAAGTPTDGRLISFMVA